MCASVHDSSIPYDSRQERAQVTARLRTLLDAAGVHEHRLVSDDELYQVWFTARWLTLTENRNPDDPNELAYTLRKLRLAQTKAGAA